jgi:hypothetical protein
MGMLQVKLNGFLVEPFTGEDAPNIGFPCSVVNVNHLRLYRLLPLGSVAFTQIL